MRENAIVLGRPLDSDEVLTSREGEREGRKVSTNILECNSKGNSVSLLESP
jgi:hypothetical protein